MTNILIAAGIIFCTSFVTNLWIAEINHRQFMDNYYRELREKRSAHQEEESVIDRYHLY